MRRVLFLFVRLTGIPFLLRELFQRRKVTILCYHDPDPRTAAAHFRLLARHYTIISLREYIDRCKGRNGAPLPPKALVVTLDDGHRDNFKLKELLEVNGFPVTIFLCSAIVGTNRRFWWRTGIGQEEVRTLKALPDDQRVARLAAHGFDELQEYSERQALSAEELSALTPRIDFQAHTRLHPILPRCSHERAVDEIAGSRRELKERFGLNIYAMAYPNGDYSGRDVEIARAAGYECALTLDAGFNTLETDLFRLRRVAMYDKADPNELIVKASGFWEFVHQAFATNTGHRLQAQPARS
jgi:peptidoglycan/xylan/chitin deacetylase (PgdA/CDA1 family)